MRVGPGNRIAINPLLASILVEIDARIERFIHGTQVKVIKSGYYWQIVPGQKLIC